MTVQSKFLKSTILAGILVQMAPLTAAVAADTYKVDPLHSTVIFRIKHLNVANFYGRFTDVGGKFVFDDADPSKSSVEVTIKAESVDTNDAKRNGHVKSADFLNARQFSKITFKSKTIKATENNQYKVSGDLTLHGVTKSLTVTIERTGEGDRKSVV